MKIKVVKIKAKDVEDPNVDAEITPEIQRLIKKKYDDVPSYRTKFAGIFGNVPVSSHSKVSRKKFSEAMKINLESVKEQGAKMVPKEVELRVDLMFFLAEDYTGRDVDRLIPPFLDSLQGYLLEKDSQVKKIVAEKFRITEIDEATEKKFYEQIFCVISTI